MNDEQIEEAIVRVDVYCSAVLSASRYEHSVRVAVMAQELCVQFGLPPRCGYLAGIAHDMCKSGKDRWLLALASRDDAPISRIENEKPSLLHGRAAAILLAGEYGVSDLSILEAVKNHTFGAPGMDALGKVVFVSDKVEPGRSGINPGFREKVFASDLDAMARLVIEDNIAYLKAKGKEVASMTLLTLETLKQGARCENHQA